MKDEELTDPMAGVISLDRHPIKIPVGTSIMSARDIYEYKISLSYNSSSSHPHSFHSIPFESRFNESETKTLIVSNGQDNILMEEDYYAK